MDRKLTGSPEGELEERRPLSVAAEMLLVRSAFPQWPSEPEPRKGALRKSPGEGVQSAGLAAFIVGEPAASEGRLVSNVTAA